MGVDRVRSQGERPRAAQADRIRVPDPSDRDRGYKVQYVGTIWAPETKD